jgi:hypothetical protein
MIGSFIEHFSELQDPRIERKKLHALMDIQFRRVFSRFDKTAVSFMNFIRFAVALIWLR